MNVVVDAIPFVPFGGYAVAVEDLLAGWDRLGTDDEIHVLATEGVDLNVPPSAHVHRFPVGRPEVLRRIVAQSRAARRVCRAVDADVLLGILPTTAVSPVGCPKVITVWDLRHELRPEQFGRGRRLLRKLSYGLGYRQAAGIICISDRTRRDLLRSRSWLESKPVATVHLAADHVNEWSRPSASVSDEPYALAFGHFPNKAVERVIDAWAILHRRGEARPLVVVGVPGSDREYISGRIRELGLADIIALLPWLDKNEFHRRFAGAGLIVFPSDFEGFGIPAAEAMWLRIPLVISDDAALLEVTGGNATVVRGDDPGALADAVTGGWGTGAQELERARVFADRYTSEEMARRTRAVLAEVVENMR